MIFLEVLGYGYPQKRCEEIICWYVSSNFPRHKLDITINHRNLKAERSLGFCDIIGKNYNPRNFLIEIDTYLEEETYTKTLIHECIHMGQFIKNDLKIIKGKRYYKGICVDCQEYYDQEHEKDAYKKENILYEKFIVDKPPKSVYNEPCAV